MSSSWNCWAAGVLPAVFLFSYSPAVDVEAGVAREVRSPDGKIGITIHTDAPLGYSITVDGKVGKYVVEVRRNGKNWYLAAITDRDARELSVPLSFLGGGDWSFNLWEDAPDSDRNAEHLVKTQRTVHTADTLQMKLAPSGGTVAIFSPAK